MTAEFHRKIIEIQKAVRQRELHRLELEGELMLSSRRKERNYDRLCNRLQALKLELLQDEQATNRRIDGLIVRVSVLEKEYEATIKKTLELKAKRKQFQLRRSLSNILRSPLDNQISIPGRTTYDPLGFNILKANKETQTDSDTFIYSDNHLPIFQNGGTHPQKYFSGRVRNQRRSSDSFLHHQRSMLQNYTPAFSNSFEQLDTDILDDSFYTGRYEQQSRRERTKSLGPENAPLLSYSLKNRGLEGFENTFQISSNTNNRNLNSQDTHNESVNEDALPTLCTQAHSNHSRTSQTISEEHKAEMSNSILKNEELNPLRHQPNRPTEEDDNDFIPINPSIISDDDKTTIKSSVKTDHTIEQQHHMQILSLKETNSNEIASSLCRPTLDLNSSKVETKPKALKLVSFSTPNQNKNNTKSLHEDNAKNAAIRSENSNTEAINSIQNRSLPREVTQTSEKQEKTDKFVLAKQGNNSVNGVDTISESSMQIAKTQPEIISLPKKTLETAKVITETSTQGAAICKKITETPIKNIDTPKKITETPVKSIISPKKVAETPITEISHKIPDTKIHSEHLTTDKSRQSALAMKKTIVESALPHSKETSNNDANPVDSNYSKDLKDFRVEKSKNDIRSQFENENQLKSSSLKKEEAKIKSPERENANKKEDLKTSNITTQKKSLNDDLDFFDEEIPIKETSAYQRMLGVLPGMGYQPTRTNEEMSENSPKASTRITSRWGAPKDGSEGGTRPSDTESIDSVEAAIQASMSTKKVSQMGNHDVESSPELEPLSPKYSPEAPTPKTNLLNNNSKQPVKTPIKLNLDSESESYSVSAGGVSEDDDFEF